MFTVSAGITWSASATVSDCVEVLKARCSVHTRMTGTLTHQRYTLTHTNYLHLAMDNGA